MVPFLFKNEVSFKTEIKLLKIAIATGTFGYIVGRQGEDYDRTLIPLVIGIVIVTTSFALTWIETNFSRIWKLTSCRGKLQKPERRELRNRFLTTIGILLFIGVSGYSFWTEFRPTHSLEVTILGIITIAAIPALFIVVPAWILDELGDVYEKTNNMKKKLLFTLALLTAAFAFRAGTTLGKLNRVAEKAPEQVQEISKEKSNTTEDETLSTDVTAALYGAIIGGALTFFSTYFFELVKSSQAKKKAIRVFKYLHKEWQDANRLTSGGNSQKQAYRILLQVCADTRETIVSNPCDKIATLYLQYSSTLLEINEHLQAGQMGLVHYPVSRLESIYAAFEKAAENLDCCGHT